jgi:hypothetical protein
MRWNRSIGLGGFAMALTAAWALGPEKDAPSPTTPGKTGEVQECGTGPLKEVRELAWMAGRWDVKTIYFAPDGKEYVTPTESVIEPMLGGSFLQERITVPAGAATTVSLVGVRSFDRFRGTYRFVWFDDMVTLADVYEGAAHDGAIVVTNVKSGTSYAPKGEPETFVRITQRRGANEDAFTLMWEASNDHGATWARTAEYRYARK